MDKYIVYETVNGHYAVRPSEWTCILNDKGQITEACNHTGLFQQKEEAEKFAEWKNKEERGLLVKLPCKVGDIVYKIYESSDKITEWLVDKIDVKMQFFNGISIRFWIDCYTIFFLEDIGKTVFLTREQAEQALKQE